MPCVHRSVVAAIALGLPAGAAIAQDFPAGATALTDQEITQRLADRVFDVKLADGVSWRLEYKANGYFFVDTSRGFRGKGDWKAQEGKLCGQLQGRDRSCNEMRLHQDLLHLKRDSGEIVQFVPR